MYALFDTGYLNIVTSSRALATARVEMLIDRLRTQADTVPFLLRFFALRLGPLIETPEWLELSAQASERKYPAAADELRDAARIERADQELLLDDVAQFERVFGAAEVARMSELPDDPKIARASKIRAMVPCRDEPLVILAVDLELAVLGLDLGPALVELARQRLPPGLDGGRFLRSRSDNAKQRTQRRSARLADLLAQQPGRASSWARVAVEVTQSYLGALEALAQHQLQQAA